MDIIYKNIDSPGAFAGVDKLYKYVKEINPYVTKSRVKDYLSNQDSYTLHRILKNKFERRGYLVAEPGHTIGVDTAYMRDLSQFNNGVNYLLIFIDIFSRYLTVYTLKTLKSDDVCQAMKKFFSNSIYNYKKLFSDMGGELTSKKVKIIYTQYKVEQYHTQSREIKCSICERVIRTIKEKISRYLTFSNQNKYVDVLQNIVDTYNITEHRGLLNETPYDIHLLNERKSIINFSKRVYKHRKSKKLTSSSKLPVGSYVRIKNLSSTQNIFRKGHRVRNTYELFKISKVNTRHIPITYELKDLDGKHIKGVFYIHELVITREKTSFSIEILKTKTYRRKKMYLVKYINYPDHPTVWIKESQLV